MNNGSRSSKSNELCIEANLVDPSITQCTKTSNLYRYRQFLGPLLKPGRNDHSCWPPDFYPYNGPFEDSASDNCHTGVHDEYKTACELKYNEEYKVFWADIRHRYGQLFRTQVRLDMRANNQQKELAALQQKSAINATTVNRTRVPKVQLALVMREETRRKELAALQRRHASNVDSVNSTGDPKIQLTKKVFSSLSPTEHDLWDQFPQSTNKIILTSGKPAAFRDRGYDQRLDSSTHQPDQDENESESESTTLR